MKEAGISTTTNPSVVNGFSSATNRSIGGSESAMRWYLPVVVLTLGIVSSMAVAVAVDSTTAANSSVMVASDGDGGSCSDCSK